MVKNKGNKRAKEQAEKAAKKAAKKAETETYEGSHILSRLDLRDNEQRHLTPPHTYDPACPACQEMFRVGTDA